MPTFIIRGPKGYAPHSHLATVDADSMRVRFGDRHRVRSERDSPIGRIRELEAIGPDRDVLEAGLRNERGGARRVDGRGAPSWNFYLRLGRDQVKAKIRRMREQDERAIAEIDANIARLAQALDDARKSRVQYVERAWRYGESVDPRVLVAKAEQDLTERPR